MKILKSTVILMTVLLAGASVAQVLNKRPEKGQPQASTENVSQVTEFKKKSREALKPYRYDASNVTHFTFKAFEQKKEFEVLMFNGSEYKLNFNTEGTPKPITIQIWDKPSSNQARVMVYEQSNVQGTEVNVLSSDLNKKYQELKNSPKALLKRVYIDYIIPANETTEPLKGFAILSYGYKNI